MLREFLRQFSSSASLRRQIVRYTFVATALYAGAMFWFAPYPPMADLPQHAGQVALWRDLLLDQSQWHQMLRVNYFTPYLIGYGLALPLSFVMPVVAAFKLMLMLAYYAFVFCCVLLRRRFDGDERLDWLFIPGFFGLAYVWGFLTFLVAAPLGLLFMLLADKYAERPTITSGIRLSGIGCILFFSHGLIFLLACGIGVALLLVRRMRIVELGQALLMYLPLGALSLTYAVISTHNEAGIPGAFPPGVFWGEIYLRPMLLLNDVFAGYDLHAAIYSAVAGVLMLWAPRLLKSPLQRRTLIPYMPMAIFSLVWLAAPFYAMQTTFMYERFALFFFPFYAFMFRRPASSVGQQLVPVMEARFVQVLLLLLCWIFLIMQTLYIDRFARESQDFETVRITAEPGERALALVFDAASAASHNPWAYLHYPLWYQAENKGLVGFNIAWFRAQIVRFRSDRLPAIQTDFSMGPGAFNWTQHEGWRYRYFFVRNTKPLPADLFKNDQCQVDLVRSAGNWSLFEASRCH